MSRSSDLSPSGSLRIEDYALIGDTHTAALIGTNGSIDWLPLPRFDSAAAFAALLGGSSNGCWKIAPSEVSATQTRRYVDETLVLETTYESAGARATVTDFMVLDDSTRRLVRVVQGQAGDMPFEVEFAPRFDYGDLAPWWTNEGGEALAVAGPEALILTSPAELTREGATMRASFTVGPGESLAFVLTWFPSHLQRPDSIDPDAVLASTLATWRDFTARCTYHGSDRAIVIRSLLTLKALTYAPTGAIVAAPTTSLPEAIAGVRNWDYRYCWLRDATFTLIALLSAGYQDEATAFIRWLVRTIAGEPSKMQIMYGVGGERRLAEYELANLDGYADSRPVRIGNAASDQFQLDVYGEIVDAIYTALKAGMRIDDPTWHLVQAILNFVESHWQNPADNGMWEVRGGRQHFTHSKVMAWVAFDRGVRMIEEFDYSGPLEEFRATREAIFSEVCARAYDPERATFTQYYGSRQLDASTLLLPLVGFLPIDDPRVTGTIAAIERELVREPFVLRYSTAEGDNVDGLPAGEGAFLACSFWLADVYALAGRYADARRLFDRVTGFASDLGLLAEEYDVELGRQVGNFPQAFSHFALVNTALNLARSMGPAKERSEGERVKTTL